MNVSVVGCGEVVTVKSLPLVAVPAAVVTRILPVLAPAGTVAWIWVPDTTVWDAAVRLNVTALTPTKLLPVMVTTVPAGPLAGVNDPMVGGGTDVAAAYLMVV